MRQERYTARRRANMGGGASTTYGASYSAGYGVDYRASATWMRNRNTVRHTGKQLGNLSLSAIIGMLVLIVGLIYVTQGTRATSYDYELSGIETEINELEAQKDDLAVEKARLTSIAASEQSTVAMAMENATVSGYAE